MIAFSFEGTALTDASDQTTVDCDLQTQLEKETCDWLTEPVVQWFRDTVREAVKVEFDRYIAQGNLQQTVERIAQTAAQSDALQGYVGMYL
jgi:hypothetical protein